ncbi:MAG: hypothetical protein U1F76_28920 [Candidatus Competibacteraceae bacterium]
MNKHALSPNLVAWAKRIALEIDPDNEALVPMMLDAYLQGGAKRKQLFESDAMVGSFAAEGIVSLLGFAFMALSFIGNELMALQASGGLGAINNLLSGWKTWLEVLKTQQSFKEKTQSPVEKSDELASLYRVSQKVEKALRKRGLSMEQSESLTHIVIKALLEEPDGGAKLIAEFPTERG